MAMMEYLVDAHLHKCKDVGEVLGKKMVAEWLLNVLSRSLIMEATIGGSFVLGHVGGSSIP